MRKLFVLIAILFYSCAASDSLSTSVNAEVIRITLPNGCYQDYVKVIYEGHEYITDWRSEFWYHLPSCPCYKSQSKSILDYE